MSPLPPGVRCAAKRQRALGWLALLLVALLLGCLATPCLALAQARPAVPLVLKLVSLAEEGVAARAIAREWNVVGRLTTGESSIVAIRNLRAGPVLTAESRLLKRLAAEPGAIEFFQPRKSARDAFLALKPQAEERLLSQLHSGGVRAVVIEGNAAPALAARAKNVVPVDAASLPLLKARLRTLKDVLIIAEDPATARSAQLMAPKSLVLLRRSEDALQGLAELQRTFSRIRVLHNVPTTKAEAAAIHDGAPPITDAYLGRLQKELTALSHRPKTSVTDLAEVSSQETIADALRRNLRADARDELRFIVAHVQDGAARFHDGSAVLISDLASYRNTWVVGCETIDAARVAPGLTPVTTAKLSYSDAFRTAAAAGQDLGGGAQSQELMLRNVAERVPESLLGVVAVTIIIEGGPVSGARAEQSQ